MKTHNNIWWEHHRSGWKHVVAELSKIEKDIYFEGYLDGFFGNGKQFNQPWIGFFHHTPTHHPLTNRIYNFNEDRSLNGLIQSKAFLNSLNNCKGLFTLSEHCKEFIANRVNVDVHSLKLPTENVETFFDLNKFKAKPTICVVGHWQRLFGTFCNLNTTFNRCILNWNKKNKVSWFLQKHEIKSAIPILPTLTNTEYDEFLSKTVIFLELYDSNANNIIVECIVRNTPVVINRLPATEEYFGKNYPLFYTSKEQAETLLNTKSIKLAEEYLKSMDKSDLSLDSFVNKFKKLVSHLPDSKKKFI